MTPEQRHRQRMTALGSATQTRSVRCELMRELSRGRATIPTVLDVPEMAGLTVERLLLALPRIGKRRLPKILQALSVSPTRQLGTLTPRERAALLALRW